MSFRQRWAAKPLIEKVTALAFIATIVVNDIVADRYGAQSGERRVMHWLLWASFAGYLVGLLIGSRSKRRTEQNTL